MAEYNPAHDPDFDGKLVELFESRRGEWLCPMTELCIDHKYRIFVRNTIRRHLVQRGVLKLEGAANGPHRGHWRLVG